MRAEVDLKVRRARVAVGAVFLTNGALFANLLTRYPEVKSRLSLTNTEFGIAVAAFPAGALIAGLAAGALIRRFRSSRVASATTVLLALCVLAAGLAPSGSTLGAALFLAGACDAVADVAMNSHGLRVQRAYGRSVLNSLHATWSVGALTGGAMGGAAAGLGLGLGWHLGGSALVFSVVVLVAYKLLLAGPEPVEFAQPQGPVVNASRSPSRAVPYVVLMMLALMVACAALIEDSGNSWSAVYMRESLGVGASTAALGFVAMTGAQFVGRVLGDRAVDRFGQRAVARWGALFATVGMSAALAYPSPAGTVVGFAAAGLGMATIVPAVFHAADGLTGIRPGSGLTVVSWLMRVGSLTSPLLVGVIADVASLRVALGAAPVAGLLVVALGAVLVGRRSMTTSRLVGHDA